MRVQSGQLVALGHGKYVRSDDVIAIEPIVEGRGPGRRTLVWVRGLPDPFVASRSDEALAREIVSPADQAARIYELSSALNNVAEVLGSIPPIFHRVLQTETGHDLDALAQEARRVVG